MIVTAECPSGLVLDVREVKGREIRQLKEAKNPLLLIAEGCTVKVVHPGPYTLHDGQKLRWAEVLAGDMMTAILKVAEAGFGTMRTPLFECLEEECRKQHPQPTPWPIDLSQVPVKKITPADLQSFLNGNRFICTVAGKEVAFMLPTGATIDAAFRLNPSAHPWKAVADSIYEIEGLTHQFDSDKFDWLDDLGADELTTLGLAMRAPDCGPELGVKVQCQWCGRERVRQLPFATLTMER